MLIRSAFIFLIVTFAISWGLPALYVFFFPNVQDARVGYVIVRLVSIFGPAIGGIVAAMTCGRLALREHLVFLTRFKIGWRWYAGTVATIALALIAVIGINYVVGDLQPFSLWSLATLFVFLPPPFGDVGAFEELGFRGWLLPLVQSKYRPHFAALIVGVIWFLFHYSVLLPGFPVTTIRTPDLYHVGLFFVQIIALSYIFTVIFNATGGSVPLVFVAHWLSNAAIKLSFSVELWIWPCVFTLIAVVVVVLGHRHLDGERKTVAC